MKCGRRYAYGAQVCALDKFHHGRHMDGRTIETATSAWADAECAEEPVTVAGISAILMGWKVNYSEHWVKITVTDVHSAYAVKASLGADPTVIKGTLKAYNLATGEPIEKLSHKEEREKDE